jgi:hypothetical protein
MGPMRRFFSHNLLLKLLSLAMAIAIYWSVHRG